MTSIHRGDAFKVGEITAIHIGKRASWAAAFTDFIQGQREGLCDVHWGHHSCTIQASTGGHEHVCKCGSVPKEWSVLRGTHLTRRERRQHEDRVADLKYMEKLYARDDDFDHKGNYRG